MNLKNLPLGINTLSVLRENDCVYVDKTKLAYHLIRIAGRFFLSRPRRFGKSLFVDTLKEIFEGNEKLFEGLYIHDKWDWGRKFPVIKIDFADGVIIPTTSCCLLERARFSVTRQRKYWNPLKWKGLIQLPCYFNQGI
ncbi:AAA family ATPase [Cylindrospermopsis raciborskii]|uniref:AAA family ATPase n=1 Tax=Cylindrospermopsis raciborskii TaxID=77022 RepID=UPI000AAC0A82|nr:AAA family ATPase [Cylindrospermopsis raciborskii]